MTQKQRCPVCKSKKFTARSDGLFLCTGCGKLYDGDPNEGGDYFADPSKRMREAEKRKPKRELRGGCDGKR